MATWLVKPELSACCLSTSPIRFGPPDEMNYDGINAITPEACRTVDCYKVKLLFLAASNEFLTILQTLLDTVSIM